MLSLSTPILELAAHGIPRLGQHGARRLALAVAAYVNKRDAREATVEDLLSYFPMRYEDRSNLAHIAQLRHGVEASLELYARVAGGYQVGKNRAPNQPLYIFEITANDAEMTGRPVVVWWFISGRHAPRIVKYYTQKFARGTRFIAYGRWEWDARRNTFALRLNRPDELEVLPGHGAPAYGLLRLVEEKESAGEDSAGLSEELLEEAEEDGDPALAAIHAGRRVPIYRKLGEFRTKRLREIIYAVLDQLPDDAIPETLPADLIARQRLIGRAEALRRIHFPAEDAPLGEYEEARSPAHRRLIFEEFFWTSFALALRRSEREAEPKGAVIEITDRMRERIFSILPFKLTTAQERAIRRIFDDMQSNVPMNRLLQGDVGSGKTVVAVLAMLAAMENGYQTALMVPTEILAEQHARNIKRLLAATPYRVELLIGSLRASEKRRLHADLAAGDIHCCIGTHALIQEAVRFHKLGLVVIDEQHRFGVLQRAALRERGYNPDVLVMTATPIPRSLAMTVYGDLDVSVIDELPPGRTPVKTVVIGEDKRAGVYRGIEREVRKGRQVYVVYPLIEESEKIDLKAATRMYEHLRDEVFPHFTVGLLHGKMKAAEKEEVMRRFVAGEIQILVSTTVVEVGVDVPNASVMVIEHAERFGLSQLHQLRGRVGRGAEQSFCVLIASDKQTSVARERLGIMEESSDGFRIAEKDLEIRGPGEILGTRQSGLPMFRLANLVRDLRLLEEARREADLYISTRRHARETLRMIERVRSDARFGLASVG
ncbi:ATP-dependent DNA helicase RecG [Pyrinomonas methylaliphatogenes]|uniref:ATP-dependent DNA helicase RecG n=1 Tax=Pyrinomonas methylaliphatogenes TaxID=454194 RepID=A0A0B6X019_9BACT|nr:ATP-dependent DNA helicase RecG [Pyrinomonas methylaliphatogenes]MBX5478547.1 ATP-dependent DNA helicase RecG [Pyrinomonas methylaliphatogenes]CDM66666.1 ATP-dependent DNA helicase RecG [Pyrinomonas methylaliphatogenes]